MGLDALALYIAHMENSGSFANLCSIFNADGVMSLYLITYAACYLISTLLLGVALGRARLIPMWAATALVISSPLTIVGFIIHMRILLNIVLALLAIGSIPAALAMLKPASKGGWAPVIEEADLTRI